MTGPSHGREQAQRRRTAGATNASVAPNPKMRPTQTTRRAGRARERPRAMRAGRQGTWQRVTWFLPVTVTSNMQVTRSVVYDLQYASDSERRWL